MPAAAWEKLNNATSDPDGRFELTTPAIDFPSRFVRAVYPSY